MPMLHELHIFGPLPDAVLQEALRGLRAEPFDGGSPLFDRQPRSAQSEPFACAEHWPPRGARSCPPRNVQSYPSLDVQNLPTVGSEGGLLVGMESGSLVGMERGLPNAAPTRQPDDAQSEPFACAEHWPPRGAQSCPPVGVQNLPPAGVESGLPDSPPIRRPDVARSERFSHAEHWRLDGAQHCPPRDAQSYPPDSVQNWPPDGVQSYLIRGLRGAEDRRRLLGALLVPVREARATALLRKVGSEIRGAAFDLEGTLTELEFVDALAERLGFGARMQARTRASMTGRTPDFRRDYEERMAALRGVEVAVMEEVIGSMTLAAGVDTLCARLHAAAIPVAVISGGCSRLGEAVRQKIAARALYATVWEERDARFTGRAASPVIDPAAKRRALEDFARTISCPLDNMAAAGDGANDIEMLSAACTSLLTHATARPPWPEILAALPLS